MGWWDPTSTDTAKSSKSDGWWDGTGTSAKSSKSDVPLAGKSSKAEWGEGPMPSGDDAGKGDDGWEESGGDSALADLFLELLTRVKPEDVSAALEAAMSSMASANEDV